MAPRSLKNSKATFWGVKDRERYGAGRAGHGEGSGGSKWKKKGPKKKDKIKKPLCFYAKRLSRESSGQLGQWHDWGYMCLDDFLPKRPWFSCLSSLPHPPPSTLLRLPRLHAPPPLCLWGRECVCASGGTLNLQRRCLHTAFPRGSAAQGFLRMLMQRCRDDIKLLLQLKLMFLSGSQFGVLKLLPHKGQKHRDTLKPLSHLPKNVM